MSRRRADQPRMVRRTRTPNQRIAYCCRAIADRDQILPYFSNTASTYEWISWSGSLYILIKMTATVRLHDNYGSRGSWFLTDQRKRLSWSIVLCESTSIVIIKTWLLSSWFGRIFILIFFSWVALCTFRLCKIKTGAYPIPTILKLDFLFFLRMLKFCQNSSSCFVHRQPPIGAARR
jgi:hypothetical protein